MGACEFSVEGTGKSVSEVFYNLCKDAVYERGHEGYNGTISTCSLGRCVRAYPGMINASRNSQIKKELKNIHLRKFYADYIDAGISHYELHGVRKTALKSSTKPVWKQRYQVIEDKWSAMDTNRKFPKKFGSYDSKSEADKVAKEAVMAGYDVEVSKVPVLVSGKIPTTSYEMDIRTLKSKPKTVPAGKKLVEIHKYIFFGMASE